MPPTRCTARTGSRLGIHPPAPRETALAQARRGARPRRQRPRHRQPRGMSEPERGRQGASCGLLVLLDQARLLACGDDLEWYPSPLRHQETLAALRIEEPALLRPRQAEQLGEAWHRLGCL